MQSCNRLCIGADVLMFTLFPHRNPATAKWYDTRDSVFIEFCVADSKDVKVNFDKTKCGFRYVLRLYLAINSLSNALSILLSSPYLLLRSSQ